MLSMRTSRSAVVRFGLADAIQAQLTTLLGDNDEFDSNDIKILVGGIEIRLRHLQQTL